MEWTRQIDGYCERVDPSFWAEPVNALSNAAFLLAAFVMWRRSSGLPFASALVFLLATIGAGSFLFHSYATVWASLADVVPIGLFVLVYLFAANLHFWNMPLGLAVLGTLAFLPYGVALAWVLAHLPFLQISAVYWPVPLLIAFYALGLRNRTSATSRGLWLGAGLLALSLVFRSLDGVLCAVVPQGTHFIWHLLNATMLGWMIEVYRRHMLAARQAGR